MERSKKISMDNAFLQKLTKVVIANLSNDQFGVEELARTAGMSRSQIHRKLNRINGKSVSKFIREIRLEEAHRLLQEEVGTASEIAYQVGFSSSTYFTKCFHEHYGYTPGEVKKIEPSTLKKNNPEIKEPHTFPIYGTQSKSHEIQANNLRKKNFQKQKLPYYIIVGLTIIVVVFVSLYLKERRSSVNTKKSIAVLPFKSLSDDPEKQYLADGVMDAIILHLSKIKGLRVMPRTSVEQYRKTNKAAKIICKELGVAYLLEGSFQKYEGKARLIILLKRPAKEEYMWARTFDRDWDDIFTVQSEVAQLVAKELQTVITPEEKLLIEKKPTLDLTAHELYQRGRYEYVKYELDNKYPYEYLNFDNDSRALMERAQYLFFKALEYDSTYAEAYVGLAWVYKSKHFWKTFLSENFLDSMLILANIALSFDDKLTEAYVLRGDYYRFNNDREKAIREYDKAIKFNPNEWQVYWNKGRLYNYDDYVKTIDNYHKAALLQRGPFLSQIYRDIASAYAESGFKEISAYYYREALKLDADSARYYRGLAGLEESIGNFKKAIELYKKTLAIDSADWWASFRLGMVHGFIGEYKEYLEYVKRYEKAYKMRITTNPNWIIWVGHAYWVNGFKKKAEYYFDEGLIYYKELLALHRHFAQNLFIYKNLAAMYAFQGNINKAFEYLEIMNQSARFPLFMIKDLKNDPLFIFIRDDPEFRKIVRDVEAKCKAEHERVRVWLDDKESM